jgi:hypothetical protein
MISVALISASLCALGATAELAEGLESKWRREYPTAAAELDEISRHFIAEGRFTFRFFSGQILTTNELTVASSGDKKLYIRDRTTTESPKLTTRPYKSIVRCRTPDRAFVLNKQSPADPYVIVSLSEKFESEEITFYDSYDMYARCATVYMQKSLLARMQAPSFVAKKVTSVAAESGELVRIDYDIEEEHAWQSGSVQLDPKLNWAIRKAEVSSKHKTESDSYEFTCKVNYEKVGDGLFFPNRMEFFGRTPKPGIYEHALLELSRIKAGDPPDQIFKLSAFGLPDIPLRPAPVSSAFSFHSPLFWGALITAVVSFTLLRATRSRKVKTSTVP